MSRAKIFTIALVALAVIAALLVLIRRDPSRQMSVALEPAKPSLVGRQVCKECHADNFDRHAHSGHALTFADASDPRIAGKFVDQQFDAGGPYGSFSYFVDEHGLHARRSDESGDETFPLHYALGSGAHGITLLSLIVDVHGEGTVGIEHRASWFGNDQKLGKTPGHQDRIPQPGPDMFGESQRGEILQKCVSCHSTTGTVVDQTIVDHIPNVNCEKCHGPGSEHVRQARVSNNPPPFSIGRADWTTESEIRLCGTCHRMPQDVSRKALREYGTPLIRFQPIGLLRSECYLQSEGELKCTTCHDPHVAVKEKTNAAYVQDCINCHLENSDAHVACPVSPSEGCIECHMPGVKGEHDVVFFDHWIRVHEDE